MEQYCSWRCIGDNPVAYYWQIVYYIYILIVLVVALILAFQTRKVKIDVLNDSKWIAGITYVGVPLIVIFFIFTFVLSSYVQLSSAVYCIGLFLASTNFLALLFIPKVWSCAYTLILHRVLALKQCSEAFQSLSDSITCRVTILSVCPL